MMERDLKVLAKRPGCTSLAAFEKQFQNKLLMPAGARLYLARCKVIFRESATNPGRDQEV